MIHRLISGFLDRAAVKNEASWPRGRWFVQTAKKP
jgi:hypothetical protein